MSFLAALLVIVAVLASLLLCAVILLQEPKGGGLAAALGGSAMEETVGVSVGRVNMFTGSVAAVWVAACFLHAVLI